MRPSPRRRSQDIPRQDWDQSQTTQVAVSSTGRSRTPRRCWNAVESMEDTEIQGPDCSKCGRPGELVHVCIDQVTDGFGKGLICILCWTCTLTLQKLCSQERAYNKQDSQLYCRRCGRKANLADIPLIQSRRPRTLDDLLYTMVGTAALDEIPGQLKWYKEFVIQAGDVLEEP